MHICICVYVCAYVYAGSSTTRSERYPTDVCMCIACSV